MTHPKRIQRQRTKGWKMPKNAVYVGRPTKYGNPWQIEPLKFEGQTDWWVNEPDFISSLRTFCSSRKVAQRFAVWKFRRWVRLGFVPFNLEDLRGKDLACWCPLDQPCHADVLLELANPDIVRATDPHNPTHPG